VATRSVALHLIERDAGRESDGSQHLWRPSYPLLRTGQYVTDEPRPRQRMIAQALGQFLNGVASWIDFSTKEDGRFGELSMKRHSIGCRFLHDKYIDVAARPRRAPFALEPNTNAAFRPSTSQTASRNKTAGLSGSAIRARMPRQNRESSCEA